MSSFSVECKLAAHQHISTSTNTIAAQSDSDIDFLQNSCQLLCVQPISCELATHASSVYVEQQVLLLHGVCRAAGAAFAWCVDKLHANHRIFCQHVNKFVTTLYQHSTAQTQVFVRRPCAVSYQDCSLQMTLIMAMVTTTTMSMGVATMAMSMATTTLVVDLLQQQLLLLQAESALVAAMELHETNVLKFPLHW